MLPRKTYLLRQTGLTVKQHIQAFSLTCPNVEAHNRSLRYRLNVLSWNWKRLARSSVATEGSPVLSSRRVTGRSLARTRSTDRTAQGRLGHQVWVWVCPVGDSDLSAALRLLADLGADAKQLCKFLTLWGRKPSQTDLPSDTQPVFSSGEMTTKTGPRKPTPKFRNKTKSPPGKAYLNTPDWHYCKKRKALEYSNIWVPLGWCKTVAEAEARRDDYLAKKKLRDRPDGTFLGSFTDYVNDIHLPGKVAGLSKCTRDQYRSLLRLHVIPIIGKLPMQTIRPLDCLQIIELNKPHCSQGALRSIRNVASGVFTDAVCKGYLSSNPIQLI